MVEDDYSYKIIGSNNLNDLKRFLKNAGNSTDSFRYFKTRPLSIIANHIVTVLFFSENNPVGYGHLDLENNIIWLGIAVAESYQGKGLGKKIMNYLVSYADENNINKICLSVDKINSRAINLYKKFNFSESSDFSNNAVIMKRLK